MRRTDPRERGHRTGAALDERGRAQRFSCGDGAELWRLPLADEPLAERLLALSRQGVGGFVDGGIDEEGIWLVRALPGETLGALRKRHPGPWPWRRALAVMRAAAGALAACEEASLLPGRLTPDTLLAAIADDDRDRAHVCLAADALVNALVGGAPAATGQSSNPKDLLWSPPELGDGASWDRAENRYALGIIGYELLSGRHPFGGAGLRHALREATMAEAAPFAEEIARELPPGLQSSCLRLIHPDPGERPASAKDIARELEQLDGVAPPLPRRARRELTVHEPRRASQVPASAARPARREVIDLAHLARLLARAPLRYAPLGVGAVALALVLAFVRSEDAPARPRVNIAPAEPVSSEKTLAQDCASCHPRHAAEWSQSAMAHSVKSPLFNALEALIEEQVGRDRDCPGGAGILRLAGGGDVCRDRGSGLAVTGSGGEHWCVNCHSPGDNLGSTMPAWQGRPGGDPRTRLPVRDLLSDRALEGISCAFCHQVHGPAGARGSGGYQGNPTWTSFETGAVFVSRPEDARGLFGIANSGYRLDPSELLFSAAREPAERLVLVGGSDGATVAHLRPTPEARAYLASSQFCGSCHDVRLFGTDVLGVRERGEHFKRLRNAYSEWAAWADGERAAGRTPASCQDCHMSSYPGACVPGERTGDPLVHESCPDGYRFEPHEPGRRVRGFSSTSSTEATALSPHYFTAVDLPLAKELDGAAFALPGLDPGGIPLGFKERRDLLLRRSVRLELGEARREGGRLTIPIEIENVGAGHKVPAGFSQERELWVHLRVEDARGGLVYEVGRVDRNDQDLRDKIFLAVNTDPDRLDAQGRPLGLFGADVADGPDVPRWSPPPELGGSEFRGRGLVNFQNGFLRCVRCVGEVSADGECLARGFERHRAERFDDGQYDLDTGECVSNLSGRAALLEIYFPVGALDADRGLVKGPDAIIDTRALSPGRPVRYVYELDAAGRPGPYRITARLMFRSFPPFLVRAFAEYEQRQAARGRRPSGPLVTFDMLERLERITLAERALVLP